MLLNIILILIVLWILFLSWKLINVLGHYNKLIAGVNKENLTEILNKTISGQEDTQKIISGLEVRLANLDLENLTHIQKVGLVRFNPFSDTGSDQSFVIALLNGQNSGLVICSMHSRSQTRWYAKPVKEGKSGSYEFSEEEKKAISEAIKNQ